MARTFTKVKTHTRTGDITIDELPGWKAVFRNGGYDICNPKGVLIGQMRMIHNGTDGSTIIDLTPYIFFSTDVRQAMRWVFLMTQDKK